MMTGGRYLENIRVLIVDPNTFMRSVIQNALQVFGGRHFAHAGDGADGFNRMRSFIPDIIFTEWMMAPLDGLELTRLVRTGKDSLNPYVPVIVVTAHAERRHVLVARHAGINGFVAKPVSPTNLLRHIIEVIEYPRAFISSTGYFGPDRRRSAEYVGLERRRSSADPANGRSPTDAPPARRPKEPDT